MQEYRMVKHLFGAVSLPSVANFCPRKTAQLNQEGFDAKVEATVKQGHSQTSEKDEASFERWKREPLRGTEGRAPPPHPPQEILKSRGSGILF